MSKTIPLWVVQGFKLTTSQTFVSSLTTRPKALVPSLPNSNHTTTKLNYFLIEVVHLLQMKCDHFKRHITAQIRANA